MPSTDLPVKTAGRFKEVICQLSLILCRGEVLRDGAMLGWKDCWWMLFAAH